MTTNFKQLAEQYKHELLDKVVPFWLDKSQDTQHGGYFTCLERDGSVFDTDKFVWLQGREVWMFATLYNKVEKRQEWLDCAIQGAEFLKKHGHDGHLNWYFALDREGHPLVEPYNIFSYTFAVIAFGQLSLATGNKEYADIAKRTFDIVLSKVDNPKGKWNKAAPDARALKSFALPMILCNVALEIEPLLDPDFMRRTIDTCIHEVMDVFYRPELQCKNILGKSAETLSSCCCYNQRSAPSVLTHDPVCFPAACYIAYTVRAETERRDTRFCSPCYTQSASTAADLSAASSEIVQPEYQSQHRNA